MRQQELESFDLCPPPASHLHHETFDALEDEFRPLETPGDRHLLRHAVGEEEGDGDGGHLVKAGRLQNVPHTDDDGVAGGDVVVLLGVVGDHVEDHVVLTEVAVFGQIEISRLEH